MSKAKLDFTHRANLREWMDEPCSYEDFRDCLRDLAQVNRVTFAHRPTLLWLQRFPMNVPLHIVDVGCGGGDMLRRLEKVAGRQGRTVRLTGVDLNPFAARAAAEFTGNSSIEWITGDAFTAQLTAPVDLVISSLFAHHLAEEEIVRFLRWMEQTATRGWFINDLSRAAVPYHAFQALAMLARWHRFVRHDGPVSIRRAFRREDWKHHVQAAGLDAESVEVEAFRPARLCVSRVKR